MNYLYTRAFCRDCRLHFEYALTEADLVGDPVVLCPRCDQPVQQGPFQPCDPARYERIEARYERLADEVEGKRVKKRARGRRRDYDWDWEEDYPRARKRRRRSR